MTILELVYRLNEISIERNNLEIKLMSNPHDYYLNHLLNELDIEHDNIIYELCGMIPTLEGDENLQLRRKRK